MKERALRLYEDLRTKATTRYKDTWAEIIAQIIITVKFSGPGGI